MNGAIAAAALQHATRCDAGWRGLPLPLVAALSYAIPPKPERGNSKWPTTTRGRSREEKLRRAQFARLPTAACGAAAAAAPAAARARVWLHRGGSRNE